MSENGLDQLEMRIARLEDELREVKRMLSKVKAQPWWERTAGMFEGSKAFAEIVRLGRKIRREDRDFDPNIKESNSNASRNRKGRRSNSKRRKA